MRFSFKVKDPNEIVLPYINIITEVDENDGDYNVRTTRIPEETLNNHAELLHKLASISGIPHGLKDKFDIFSEEEQNLLYTYLKGSEFYSDNTHGYNSFGHTLANISAYYVNGNNSEELDLNILN